MNILNKLNPFKKREFRHVTYIPLTKIDKKATERVRKTL